MTNQPDKDVSVFGHITRLADEEHKLFDQCWDFQRHALREFGDDPSRARVRDADVVKKYSG
jgi:Protein of unknown function (DUF2630)